MRTNKKQTNRERLWSGTITAALVCALAIGVMSVVLGTRDKAKNLVDLNETSANDVARNEVMTDAVIEMTIESQLPDRQPAEAENVKVSEAADKPVAADSDDSVKARFSFSENDSMQWPVQGNVIMKYNMDSTVYYKTLGVYKVNPAINISADSGTQVLAAASGVVLSVADNEETGKTVSVDIGNGYVTTYGLLADVSLKKGMTVMAGDIIGKVSEPTKYYTEEGPNLYFKVTKDDVPVDPVNYMSVE